ncbi:diacylglycerol kinase, partial [Mycobacterium kansasii]
MRWPRGRRRYDIAMALEAAKLRPLPFRIELDDQVIDTDVTLVAVGNGTSYGGGMRICPGAILDDGLLDITVVAAGGRLR